MKNLILVILLLLGVSQIFAQATKETIKTSPALQEATNLSVEAVKLFQQKKYDAALHLAKKVVEIRARESGKSHLSVGQAWRNLAYIQQQRGKLDEAESAFQNALDIYESNQPLSNANEKTFAELLDIVATYQANEGGFEKAEKKFERSIELREKLYGRDSLEASDSLLKLAQVYQLKLGYDKAAPLLLRALEIKAAKLGNNNDDTRYVYSNATCALTKLGQSEEVKQLKDKFYPLNTKDGLLISDKVPTINGGVINGKALELAKPSYPAEARAKRASGAVNVQVTIDESGKVIFACALTGAKELQRASEIAAYNSKFSPTTLEGQTVKVTGVIVYNFVP
jgi:TonB family protein